MENHRTKTDYEDRLILKIFAFEFINNYGKLLSEINSLFLIL